MTLVVSEASTFGIAMVGDSAVTVAVPGGPPRIVGGAAKIQYAAEANIGFAMWGDACVGGQLMDSWLADFIAAHDRSGADIDSIGALLEGELRSALKPSSRSWNQMRRGIHVAGFLNGIPHIYHVHTGHDPKAQHEPTLFRDYPYGVNLTPVQFQQLLRQKPHHIRNGYFQHFAAVYQSFEVFTKVLPQIGIPWPGANLEDRCSLLSLQAQVVALTLQWSGRHQGVNSDVSAVAFTPAGLVVDRRATPTLTGTCGSAAELMF